MYETEIYLDGLRRKLFPTLYTVFFICIGIFALSSAASYFVSSHFFRSSIPLLTTVHANTDLPSILVCRLPTLVTMMFLTVSAFTHFTSGAVIAMALWKGLSLGTFVCAASSGAIVGLSEYWIAGCVFVFAECAVTFIFAAFCVLYSEAECVLRASGERVFVSAVSAELLRCSFVLGGCALVLSAIAENVLLV